MQTTKSPEADLGITFISTGTVRIRKSMRSQPVESSMFIRRLRSLIDWNWTDPLPVGVFLLHHSEGPILFDTGQSPLCNQAGYFPRWNIAANSLAKYFISPQDSLLTQLHAHGVNPKDLQAIIVSHLHSDHTGGLKELHEVAPNVPVYVSAEQWRVFGQHPFYATLEGCAPAQWPKGFSPKILKAENHAIGPWPTSYSLTTDGRVTAVDTPGHVPGHVSLVVYGSSDDGTATTYFLTGDAVYGLDLLDIEQPDGINSAPQLALRSLRLIKEFARQNDVVVLPSHDANTPRLLAKRSIYKPNDTH